MYLVGGWKCHRTISCMVAKRENSASVCYRTAAATDLTDWNEMIKSWNINLIVVQACHYVLTIIRLLYVYRAILWSRQMHIAQLEFVDLKWSCFCIFSIRIHLYHDSYIFVVHSNGVEIASDLLPTSYYSVDTLPVFIFWPVEYRIPPTSDGFMDLWFITWWNTLC
jgi:hypothetical protein